MLDVRKRGFNRHDHTLLRSAPHRYPFPALENLPEDIRTRILKIQEKAGFIPNVFLGLARRPAEWRAFCLPRCPHAPKKKAI